MKGNFQIKNSDKLAAYLCILPIVLRFILSYLFLHLTRTISNNSIALVLSSVLNALSWVLPFAMYGAFFSHGDELVEFRKSHVKVWQVFFSACFFATVLSVLYSFVLAKLGYSAVSVGISEYGVVGLSVFVFSSIVLVPVSEEFAFRGILLKNLMLLGRVPAIVISAALFSFCHDVSAYVYSFVFGIALAVICIERSFWLSVIVHAVNNAISCVFIIIENYFDETVYYFVSTFRFAVISVLGVICTVMIIKARWAFGKKS